MNLLSAAAALALTVLAMPVVLAGLRRVRAMDHPNERSSHEVPTLRGGGLGPIVACFIVTAIVPGLDASARIALLLVAGGFGLLGAVEDLRGLSPAPRFVVQMLIAGLAAWVVHPLGNLGTWQVWALAAAGLWLVAYVNAFNFMDGINGLSAAQVIAGGAGFAVMGAQADSRVLAVAGSLVAGAALGFAPFNFPKARVFLGDSGSYFFGGWLALLAVLALSAGLPVYAVVSPFLIYLADTGVTLARRVLRGEAWHQPHRSHVYQRLNQLGWSHPMTTGVVFAAIVACTALGVAAIDSAALGTGVAVAGMGLLVGIYLASPALVTRFRARQSVRI
ncbi:MAG: MraY family glycosyltransferase [Euzebya sp.]